MKKTLCAFMIALISLGAVSEANAGWKMRAFFRDNHNRDDSGDDEYVDDIPRKVRVEDTTESQRKGEPYEEPSLHHLYRAYGRPNSMTCIKYRQ